MSCYQITCYERDMMLNTSESSVENAIPFSRIASSVSSVILKLSFKGFVPDASFSVLALQYGVFYATIIFAFNFSKNHCSHIK
jgi:hypothetical protein